MCSSAQRHHVVVLLVQKSTALERKCNLNHLNHQVMCHNSKPANGSGIKTKIFSVSKPMKTTCPWS